MRPEGSGDFQLTASWGLSLSRVVYSTQPALYCHINAQTGDPDTGPAQTKRIGKLHSTLGHTEVTPSSRLCARSPPGCGNLAMLRSAWLLLAGVQRWFHCTWSSQPISGCRLCDGRDPIGPTMKQWKRGTVRRQPIKP